MTRKSEDKNEASQMKHSPQDTPYFIPDPTNPDSLLGPIMKTELDLFHESRRKPTDIVDEAILTQLVDSIICSRIGAIMIGLHSLQPSTIR